MKQLKFAKSIFKIMLRDRIAYPGRLLADTITVIARFFVLTLLYFYMFKIKGGTINGLTFQIAVWSMYLYFLFMTLRIRGIANTISDDIRSGAIADIFTKPINYLLYRSWWQLGQGLYSFFIILFFGIISLILTVGVPHTITNIFFISTFLIIFFTSIVLGLFLYMVVGLLAFWIEDIKPVFWIVDKMVMILGGSYIPIALFPKAIYNFTIWSPFGASQFITHTVYNTWQINFFKFLGIQLFWIVLFGFIVYVLNKKAIRRLTVKGG